MRLAALSCAVLLVLAGCGGGTAPASDPANSTAGPMSHAGNDVAVVGGEVPVDADTVFDRVRDLTGEQAEPPTVSVEAANESPDSASPPRFWTDLGITPHNESDPTGPYVRTHGSTGVAGESVTVYEWVLADDARAETTLAHEFVHVVQFQNGWLDAALDQQSTVGGDLSYDGALTYYLLQEGVAVYVQSAYEQRYLPNHSTAIARQEAAYENASAYARLLLARYHLGAEYVADRAGSPQNLEALHRDPPTSTEQVLHNVDDPIENVTVTTDGMDNWTERERDRQGELFLRIALRTELNKSTAVDAAAGWGEDRRLTFVRGNATATAWVLHWDDAANATEFERAFGAYLAEKATERNGVWYENEGNATYRFVRPSNETTVLLLGNESFVKRVNATGTAENTVSVAD